MIKIIAEIGINHNGDLTTAMRMVQAALNTGCDYVKFQKRTPDACVPEAQKNVMRSTPWGDMTYLEYKKRIEFGAAEFDAINREAPGRWFVSVWDVLSVDFAMRYGCQFIKVPSAKLTDHALLKACRQTNREVILSTGMSTMQEISEALNHLTPSKTTLMHAVSAYPLEDHHANLKRIKNLRLTFGLPVGYSDHTRGIHIPAASAAMGVTMVEKHFTLDRTMWGTDQAASLEPDGMAKMVRNIHAVDRGMGDGTMDPQQCEMEAKCKLRG